MFIFFSLLKFKFYKDDVQTRMPVSRLKRMNVRVLKLGSYSSGGGVRLAKGREEGGGGEEKETLGCKG